MSDDADKSRLDQALDVFVYLPVGFVFELPRSIPRFIERGRELLGGPDDATRSLVPGLRLDRLHAQTHNTLRALGVVHDPPRPAPERAPRDTEGSGPARTEAGAVADRGPDGSEAASPPGEPAAPPVPAGPSIDVGSLAIPDYDSLSASQVIPRLDSLTGEELEDVRRYEAANRGRKTILNKIAQLHGV